MYNHIPKYVQNFIIVFMLVSFFVLPCSSNGSDNLTIGLSAHDLVFDKLAKTWDEAIPLGNGMLGALIWEKDDKLRFSLDRADLWDLRPMNNLDGPEWSYEWVYNQWKNGDYSIVQDLFDKQYIESPAPTKIPAGALEFDQSEFGQINSVHLNVESATCQVKWNSGVTLTTFVHADEPVGWFVFEGIAKEPVIELIEPAYNKVRETGEVDMAGARRDLQRLGYPQGLVERNNNKITYTQAGWGGFRYKIQVIWKNAGKRLVGCWSIDSEYPDWEQQINTSEILTHAMQTGFVSMWASHKTWWTSFWNKSIIDIPDRILEKQWYLEQYKFGSAARKDAPPISLQAVWTADDGLIPPWKGDFHHDLNTQLSYWPSYSGNHLDLEEGYINWLWTYKNTFERYTQNFFHVEGLNVPGVTTLTGEPLGGWIQYSFSPTVAAWLGQHFYLHWRYSMDRAFLENKAYPWIKQVAVYFDHVSVRDENDFRKLPISSSPEIFNNSRKAWFAQTTNFDLALIRWTYLTAKELALELDMPDEAEKWQTLLGQWPDFAIDEKKGLMIAPEQPYPESHRHFSHLLAFHPLGIFDYSHGKRDKEIIQNTLENLIEHGSDWWTGYSFSWLGNLQARAQNGPGAVKALRTFATCFCLPNSFHVNGDQSGTAKSNYTYRPFTLEGNFAFAAGVQEMLLQSHGPAILIFPAIPDAWKNVEFRNLRAQGAFLVSARKKDGTVKVVEIKSLKGEQLSILNPFPGDFSINSKVRPKTLKNTIIEMPTKPNEKVVLQAVN
jgi:alpha-L-fucosidase 2